MWYMNKGKDKSSTIILIDAKKHLINSTYIHYRKAYQSEHRGNASQHNKSYLWQTHSQHNSKWWKAESLFAKIWNKRMIPTLTTSIHYNIESHRHGNQTRERKKECLKFLSLMLYGFQCSDLLLPWLNLFLVTLFFLMQF